MFNVQSAKCDVRKSAIHAHAHVAFTLLLFSAVYTPAAIWATSHAQKQDALSVRQPRTAIPQKTTHDTGIVRHPRKHPHIPGVVFRGPASSKKIALTFDACATHYRSRYDERIVKILVETKTPATFFLGGKWMKDLPEETKRIASVPFFELGNHSYSHPHMTDLSEEQVRGEIEKTQDILFSLTGRHARFFRPPYGEYDSLLVHRSKQLGLTTVDYSLPSGDPDTTITKDRMVQYVASMARGGSIVIMHVNRRGWHTAEALPEIINYLKTRGFEFVTVSELVGEDQKSKGKDQN